MDFLRNCFAVVGLLAVLVWIVCVEANIGWANIYDGMVWNVKTRIKNWKEGRGFW